MKCDTNTEARFKLTEHQRHEVEVVCATWPQREIPHRPSSLPAGFRKQKRKNEKEITGFTVKQTDGNSNEDTPGTGKSCR